MGEQRARRKGERSDRTVPTPCSKETLALSAGAAVSHDPDGPGDCEPVYLAGTACRLKGQRTGSQNQPTRGRKHSSCDERVLKHVCARGWRHLLTPSLRRFAEGTRAGVRVAGFADRAPPPPPEPSWTVVLPEPPRLPRRRQAAVYFPCLRPCPLPGVLCKLWCRSLCVLWGWLRSLSLVLSWSLPRSRTHLRVIAFSSILPRCVRGDL